MGKVGKGEESVGGSGTGGSFNELTGRKGARKGRGRAGGKEEGEAGACGERSSVVCLHTTVHSTLYTPHSTFYTVHATLYTRHSSRYTPYLTLYPLHSSPTARHQHSSATFTLRAPLLPSSYLKEPHSKWPPPSHALSSLQSSHAPPPQSHWRPSTCGLLCFPAATQ